MSTTQKQFSLVCRAPQSPNGNIPSRLRQITISSCLIPVLVGVLLCGGCSSPPKMAPVLPDASVAQLLEFHGHKVYKVVGVHTRVDKVDGVKVWPSLKGSMKGVGWIGNPWGDWATVFELTPGVHTFEVGIGDYPLTIELNARAGHIYRLRAHNYDEVTTSLYIEDVSTGEVVSGHRPENVGARRPGRKVTRWW